MRGNWPVLCWNSFLPWVVFGFVFVFFVEASANLTFSLENFLGEFFILSLPAVKLGLAVCSPVRVS